MAESMPDSRSGDPGSKASIGRRVPAGAPEQTLPKIIIVTGTPGVGKTAVGKLLAKRIGSEFLSLGDLVKTQGLHKGFDRRARSYIIDEPAVRWMLDRKSTRLNSSHVEISYAVFCLKKKKTEDKEPIDDD